MPRKERIALIKELEKQRESRVLCYVTGDRPNMQARIASDVVRLIYEHLLTIPETKRLDLFLYSTGGHGDVPWKIVPMLREFCEELCVLLPYKAYSAATLVAIGTDSVLMGKKAELGPVDPSMQNPFHPPDPYSPKKKPLEIGVEDITAFMKLFEQEVQTDDKNQIAECFKSLTDKVGPLALGRLNRTLLHNRLLIEKLLKNRKEPPAEKKIEEISSNLTEKIYFHGHAINRREAAEDVGLDNVIIPDGSIESLMWKLFLEYEKELLLDQPFEAEVLLEQRNTDNTVENNLKIAFVESVDLTHVYTMDMRIQRLRKMPTNLHLNVNVGLPPGVDPAKIPQQAMQAIQRQVQQSVVDQIRLQSDVIGVQATRIGGGWRTEA